MKEYLILVFFILFIGCQQKKENLIESIEVLYYNGIFERVVAVGCNEIVYFPERVDTLDVFLEDGTVVPREPVILKKSITDKKVLHEVAIELSKHKVISEDYVDARMKCYLHYKNGQTDSLCIGNNPVNCIYNNQPIKITNRLVYLIRQNCGFYRWIGMSEFPYFGELNDSSFKREKVVSISGEEY